MSELRQAQLADALLRIAADRGLDRVSVREVASAAGVSIGAVQYYFSTKDEMLAFAFRQVVDRTRARVSRLEPGAGPRQTLAAVLRQLLPLDARRLAECRVYLAFAARATTSPTLAAIQNATLAAIHEELRQTLAALPAPPSGHPVLHPVRDARLLLALVDGLMFDAVTAPTALPPAIAAKTLDLYLERLLPGSH
ncbi:TetR/AcrR family transcriptional regulator [Streptomyces yaizuensis]|uniref:TetR family transcriptional regulator n=1 Tax=Streptomyces yaizuensis TaxID=2989713 RepID=A0ABQ5NX59_9ACTN|nr:TetR/AcrR family transcriptional regulator [Streptomyces sp. YSPA8]GLF94760.1 TetR family transcriptional regulator [Streptomyces sp. YSPA8]